MTTPPYVGLAGKLAARRYGSGHAHWIMDLYPDAMAAHGLVKPHGCLCRRLERLTRWQLRGANPIWTLGPYMAARTKRYADGALNSPVDWMPLWSDPELEPWPEGAPNPLRQQRGWGAQDLVLMYSGNMGLGHRFGEFLAAAERLGQNGPRWAFAGNGRRRREVEAFARTHSRARIELLLYAPPEQLREHLCAADVHLISLESVWQGIIVPSKLQASFAVGRPVLFIGGRENEIAAWIEQSGGGWVVAEGDVAGAVAAVAQARNPAERYRRGMAGHAFAQEHFQMTTNCGRIADSLELVC